MIEDFSDGLLGLEKMYAIEEKEIVLSQDTIIEGMMIPEGTIIKYSVNVDNEITDDWEWEFDFNIE